ncbi:hypothetical protein [Hymenobacter metallilatus]|uniref:Uncharacterized protein n=1 Tax=Hymenobacter metallilatus TaxID=2493666 RepID=A0A3R9U6R2_9BACT|nr:hypothetical protein [Hymenobacter metallilatus]RSK23985.1 hypothetical protein EI290_21135 [Hymenobacter metallilatus]
MSEPTPTSRILRINVLAILAVAVVLGLLSQVSNGASMVLFVVIYLGLALVNLVLGIVHFRRGPAAYFLSALLVFLIGFGSCAAMFMLGGLGNI